MIKKTEILTNSGTEKNPKMEVMGMNNYAAFLADKKKSRDLGLVKTLVKAVFTGNKTPWDELVPEGLTAAQEKDYKALFNHILSDYENTEQERENIEKMGPHALAVIQKARGEVSIPQGARDMVQEALGDTFVASPCGTVSIREGAVVSLDDMLTAAGRLSVMIDAGEEITLQSKLAFGDMWRQLDDIFTEDAKALRAELRKEGSANSKKLLKMISVWKGVVERMPDDMRDSIPEDAKLSHVLEILGHKLLTDRQKKSIFKKAYDDNLPQQGEGSYRELIDEALGKAPSKEETTVKIGRYGYLLWSKSKGYSTHHSNDLNTRLLADEICEAIVDFKANVFVNEDGEDVPVFPVIATEQDLINIIENGGVVEADGEGYDQSATVIVDAEEVDDEEEAGHDEEEKYADLPA